jgi:carbamoyltransferase
MPNPGDAGSSLGAALSVHGSHVEWSGPYLGHEIKAPYPVDDLLGALLSKKIAGVAVGRAEFGPRALGNRSLFADPRDPGIKSIVNTVKKREEFRPFAPVVLAEHASEWFGIRGESPYMQFAVRCRKPDLIPSVVHVDGTSRVQTVSSRQHPGLYELLTKWHAATGVPVLLNTSLNIKNQPLINDIADAIDWQSQYPDVPIFYGQVG